MGKRDISTSTAELVAIIHRVTPAREDLLVGVGLK